MLNCSENVNYNISIFQMRLLFNNCVLDFRIKKKWRLVVNTLIFSSFYLNKLKMYRDKSPKNGLHKSKNA